MADELQVMEIKEALKKLEEGQEETKAQLDRIEGHLEALVAEKGE